MNNANAFGFLVLGSTMGLMPFLEPVWFQHVALDGSSTRALWCETVGSVQFFIGLTYLIRDGVFAAIAGIRRLAAARGAMATGDWQGHGLPADLVAVDFGTAAAAGARIPVTHRVGAAAPVVFASEAAVRWLSLGRTDAAEARLTNLVGRAGPVRQAA